MAAVDTESLRAIAYDWFVVDRRPRMIVRRSGEILWMNQATRDMLEPVRFVRINGVLSIGGGADEDFLQKFLHRLEQDLQTIVIALDNGNCHLVVCGRYLESVDACCLEFRLDHETVRPVLANFASVFRLTKSEAKTAVALFEGMSATDIARSNAVSVDTVRSHVRQIYAKLGTGSREQFFRRLQPFCIG